MTIFVKGESELAKKIRTNLAITFPMAQTEGAAGRVIAVDVQAGRSAFAFDSIDTPLERAIFKHLRRATKLPIETHTAGGVQSEKEVLLLVPAGVETEAAAEKAIQQGFLTLLNIKAVDLSSVAVPVSADQVPQMRALLNEVFTQLCEVLSGTARDAGRDQAKQDYEALGLKMDSRLQMIQYSIESAQLNAERDHMARLLDAEQQHSKFKEEIRAMLEVRGNRHAGFWSRLWAALRGRVVVVSQ